MHHLLNEPNSNYGKDAKTTVSVKEEEKECEGEPRMDVNIDMNDDNEVENEEIQSGPPMQTPLNTQVDEVPSLNLKILIALAFRTSNDTGKRQTKFQISEGKELSL